MTSLPLLLPAPVTQSPPMAESSPAPPFIVSLPPGPTRQPPKKLTGATAVLPMAASPNPLSLPSPKLTVSLPALPNRSLSSPPRPLMVSSPFRPAILLSPPSPVRVSLKFEPTMYSKVDRVSVEEWVAVPADRSTVTPEVWSA